MTWARKTTLVMSVTLASLTSGCVLDVDDDDDGFVLSVELYWDYDLSSDEVFEGTTCRDAEVDSMDYELVNRRGRIIRAETFEPCADGFDFVDVPFGTYSLFVWGFDRDGDQLWSTECTALDVPFSGLYECDVPSPGLL